MASERTEVTRINRRSVRIQWGDCDPAGIVYFPRYFDIFDASTWAAFEAVGLLKAKLLEQFGLVGIPTVDIRASFLVSCTFGDDVVVETSVGDWGRSSFKVHHQLLKGGTIAVESREVRVWAARDPGDPTRLRGRQIPREVTALFGIEPVA